MGSVSERLRKQAVVRTKQVTIGDETYTVREVSSSTFAKYGETIKVDRLQATGLLLEECVLEEDGSQALTAEDVAIVSKVPRLVVPLVSAIMEISGIGDDEKKSDAG